MKSGTPDPSRSPRRSGDRWFALLVALAVLLAAGWLAMDGGGGPPRWWWRLAAWEFPVRPVPTPRGPERPRDLVWSPGPDDRPAAWRRFPSVQPEPGTDVGGPVEPARGSMATRQVKRETSAFSSPAGAIRPGAIRSGSASSVEGTISKRMSTLSVVAGGGSSGAIRIVIHARLHILELYRDSLRLMSAPVGLGRGGSTPVGRFPVVSMAVDPAFRSPSGRIIPGGNPGNPLGRRWVGFSVPGRRGLAIHGTTDPASIGQDRSHGCIRMRDHDLEALYRLIARDVLVEIVP